MPDGTTRKIHLGADRLTNAAVWSEICYLDSSTDYREYLPEVSRYTQSGEMRCGTSARLSPGSHLGRITVLAILACLLLLLLLRN
jgi:hypothetical protein